MASCKPLQDSDDKTGTNSMASIELETDETASVHDPFMLTHDILPEIDSSALKLFENSKESDLQRVAIGKNFTASA
jgi:hypothetical protein